jgi:hypothetical protein
MISDWLGYRRRARALRLWNQGYEHAAGQLLRGVPPYQMADHFLGDQPFAQGVQSALNAWERRPYAR